MSKTATTSNTSAKFTQVWMKMTINISIINLLLDVDMILVKGHGTLLDHPQQMCEILSGSEKRVWSKGLDNILPCMHCYLDLEDMTFGHSHGTPFDRGQQLNAASKLPVNFLWPRTKFWICMHCDLDFRDMTLVMVITHHWVINNHCVKHHLNPSYQWKLMVRTMIFAMWPLWPWPLIYYLCSHL